MDLGIKGKKALVVGASKGMGRAAAVALAAAGCQVWGVARNVDALDSVPGLQGRCYCDLKDIDDVIGFAAEDGGPDIIVHVAGGSIGIRDPLSSAEDMMKVWMANLGYAHEINRVFLPAMAERGWGRIVHFSSNGVKLATGNVPYISSKGAVEAYVRNMSRLYSEKGVVITAVSPGPIHTPGIFMYDQDWEWTRSFFDKYVPMKRWGRNDEVGNVVAMLCSEHSSYMAGAIVPIDGGMR